MPRMRRLGRLLLPVVAVVAVGRLLVPAAPREVAAGIANGLWTGAYHVHTTRSDGSGSPAEVAAEAAAAGLDFVILTDHGDGTRPPLPPAYLSGVLVIDGVEISTTDGHFVALDLPQTPYPLAGDGRDVAADVARLGGIGILAHPDSTRSTLAWHDPSTSGDGLELLNADSAWRDEATWTLLRRMLSYPWRPASVIATTLSYPTALLEQLDDPRRPGPSLGLAGVDAHARVGFAPGDEPSETSRTLARMPAYASSFGTFGLAMPWGSQGPTGDATHDARRVLDAVRAHAVHVVVFALAGAAPLRVEAETDRGVLGPGARLSAGTTARLTVRVPPIDGAWVRLLRNGRPWREQTDGADLTATHEATAPPAVYRAEVWLPHRWQQPRLPWMTSQAIAIGTPDATTAGPPAPGPAVAAPTGWHVEHDETSTVWIDTPTDDTVQVRTRLGAGVRSSQFAAAVVTWPVDGRTARALTFTGAASRPMRVSVQLREAVGQDGHRWVRSVYLDTEPRTVHIPLDDLRPIAPAVGPPPADRLHALLFVVDTVNATPGDAHVVTLGTLRLHATPDVQ